MCRSVWNVAPSTARPKGSPARSTALRRPPRMVLTGRLPVLDDVGVGALPGVLEDEPQLIADRDDLRPLERRCRLVAMDGDVAEVGIDVLLPGQRQHVREPQLRGEGRDGDGEPDVVAGVRQPAPQVLERNGDHAFHRRPRAARPETD